MKMHVSVQFKKPSYLPKTELIFSVSAFETKPEDIAKDLLRCIFKEDIEYDFKIISIKRN